MAKNEVGEFELVLGNKQLLSVFFIVVVLLGVFFTMGYIVGRNSGNAGNLEATNRKPTIVDSPSAPATLPPNPEPEAKREEPSVPPPAAETPKTDDKTAKAAAAAKREAEQRLADEKIAEENRAEQKRLAEEKKAADKKADKKDDKKAKADKSTAEPLPHAPSGPLSGTYLQLAAVPRTEADLMISVLQRKGFKAAAGPGPEGSNLFRVLVGPLAGADAISATRNSLNDVGMPGSKAIVKRF
jgi:flagellar biosynthesis GTPase FlhF